MPKKTIIKLQHRQNVQIFSESILVFPSPEAELVKNWHALDLPSDSLKAHDRRASCRTHVSTTENSVVV